jgi:hypothetical protein
MAKHLFGGTNTREPFDANYLHSILEYNSDTGEWRWRVPRRGTHTGQIAGYINKGDGRRRIRIDYVAYLSSNLAWLYMTGEWPRFEIDHIDRNRANDRWNNFRLVTRFQQMMNKTVSKLNTSGVTGVLRCNNRWFATIRVNGKRIFLGSFLYYGDAVAARKKAEIEYYGEFGPVKHGGRDLFK